MKNFVKMLCLSIFVLSLESCLINVDGNYSYEDSENYEVGNAEIYDTVKKLDVDWVAGNVKIEMTDENYLYFVEKDSSSYSNNRRVHYFYDEDTRTLRIKFCESSTNLLFDDFKKDIRIYVPKSYSSLTLKINTVSADVTSTVKCVSNVDIDSVSGNAKIREANEIEKIDFNSVSGDLTAEAKTIKQIESDTTSGDVSVNVNYSEKMTFNSVSGDAYVACPKKLGYVADLDSVNDNFKTNVTYRKNGNKRYYGDEELKIKMDSVSGKLEVHVE